MSSNESLRRDLIGMVEELRCALNEIGTQGGGQTNVVSNARDRLRYISVLTEQAAGRTLNAAEVIGDRLRAQKALAKAMLDKARSPDVRAFLLDLQAQHEQSCSDLSEIIQAQAFQDLVGQVINKLLVLVQKMEDNLVHLLVEEAPDGAQLAGPAVTPATTVTQDEVDDLFG